MSESERSEESAGGIHRFPGGFQPATYWREIEEHDADCYEGIIENGTLSIQPADLDDGFIEMSRWISARNGSYLTRKDMDGGLAPHDDPEDLLLAIEVTYDDEPHYQIQEQGGSPGIIVHYDDLDDLGDWR